MTCGRRRGPSISAHRGGREAAPAGTYEAYRSAVEMGAEYVEFDVRRTRDGKLVAFHAPRVPGAVARAGAVASLSYAGLCTLAGYEVPLVTELMRLLAGRAAGHLDLKEIGGEVTVAGQALQALGVAGLIVTTRDDAVAAALKDHFPATQVGLTIGGDLAETARFAARRAWEPASSRLDRVLACRADWAVVHHRLGRKSGLLHDCRRRGIKTMIWTVNRDPALAKWLTHPDVDVVVTDRPGHAAVLRDRLAPTVSRPATGPASPTRRPLI